MNELLLLALLVSEEPYAKVEATPQAWVEQVQWGHYRSPYRTYYPGPGYRTPYWGPRPGYWGPRWQRDPYWQFCAWRGGC
jgi:hypothetical protein